MNIWLKLGVRHEELSQEGQEALRKFAWWWSKRPFGDLFVTSTGSDQHLPYSYHYTGNAFDVRYPDQENFYMPGYTEDTFQAEMHTLIGQHCDVLFEASHIHIELEYD